MSTINYSLAEEPHSLSVDRSGHRAELELDGAQVHVSSIDVSPPRITFLYEGKPVTAHVGKSANKRWVHLNGKTLVLTLSDARARRVRQAGTHPASGSGLVIAPMPGQVRAVMVQEGDLVTRGQPLLILEAMKMELQVRAPRDGVIVRFKVLPMATVEREQILAEIEDPS